METIVEIQKNSKETIKAILQEYRGKQYIDIRIWYTDKEGNEHRSRKGLTITPEIFGDFEYLIGKVSECLDKLKK